MLIFLIWLILKARTEKQQKSTSAFWAIAFQENFLYRFPDLYLKEKVFHLFLPKFRGGGDDCPSAPLRFRRPWRGNSLFFLFFSLLCYQLIQPQNPCVWGIFWLCKWRVFFNVNEVLELSIVWFQLTMVEKRACYANIWIIAQFLKANFIFMHRYMALVFQLIVYCPLT